MNAPIACANCLTQIPVNNDGWTTHYRAQGKILCGNCALDNLEESRADALGYVDSQEEVDEINQRYDKARKQLEQEIEGSA
jgi:hypothetical protein